MIRRDEHIANLVQDRLTEYTREQLVGGRVDNTIKRCEIHQVCNSLWARTDHQWRGDASPNMHHFAAVVAPEIPGVSRGLSLASIAQTGSNDFPNRKSGIFHLVQKDGTNHLARPTAFKLYVVPVPSCIFSAKTYWGKLGEKDCNIIVNNSK
ncbi:MAG: hypothetical protein HGA96_16610 [Desulfobulbaceae bacterium]|nr:hypothetical protein [Desulfobulbaceae bacterium]